MRIWYKIIKNKNSQIAINKNDSINNNLNIK